MKKTIIKTLRVQLFLLILPLLLVLILVTLGSTVTHTRAMQEMVATRNLRTVQALTAALELQKDSMPGEGNPDQWELYVKQWMGENSPGKDIFFLVIDSKGNPHSLSDAERLGTLIDQLPSMVDKGKAWDVIDQKGGDKFVAAIDSIDDTDQWLVMLEPWSAASSPRLQITQLAPLVLIPALALATIMLGYGLRQIVLPLRRLGDRVSLMGDENFDAIGEPVGGVGEIQQLQRTLITVAEQLKEAQSEMRCYANAITQGQEEERARLARELHDETVQSLIALEHQAYFLAHTMDSDIEIAGKKAIELATLARNAVQEVRRIIQDLRPLYLDDLGWLPAVQAMVTDLNTQRHPVAELTITGKERRLEPLIELTFYRIAQEAIRNAVRHSKCSRLTVHVSFENATIKLSIKDDGRGFVPPTRREKLVSARHYGLAGMYERAHIIGAELCIDSSPGLGTEIRVVFQKIKNE